MREGPQSLQEEKDGNQGRPKQAQNSVNYDPRIEMLLKLQRTVGNSSVSTLVAEEGTSGRERYTDGGSTLVRPHVGVLASVGGTLQIQRAASGTELAEAPPKEKGGASKIREVASELAEETLKGVATGVVEDEIPFVAVINKTIELSSAFGDGVVEGIMKARDELNYDKDIATAMSDSGEGLSDKAVEAIQHVRHWQANAVAKLDEVLLSGLKFALERAVEMAGEWLAGKIADKALEKLGHAVSKFIRGRFSSSSFAHAAEGDLKEAAHEAAKAIREAFADAVGSKVFEATGEGVKTEFEAKKKLSDARVMSLRDRPGEQNVGEGRARVDALSEAVELYARVHMSLEDVTTNIDEKIAQVFADKPELKGSSVNTSYKQVKAALEDLGKLIESYNQLGLSKYTPSGFKQAAQLKEQIDAAKLTTNAHLGGLEMSLGAAGLWDVKFGTDIAAIDRIVGNL